jgi:hypothetical protein
MARITSQMIWLANQQSYSGIAQARSSGYAFTMVEINYGRGIAFIGGARSFENARQFN